MSSGTEPASSSPDIVNHPPHYNQHPAGIECIDVIEHFGFNIGSAIKYLWRTGLKEGADEMTDLQKAEWYVKREIERRKPSKQPSSPQQDS